MEHYFVTMNQHAGDEHEVHKDGCPYMPANEQRLYLGEFVDGLAALEEARKYYPKAIACRWCCPECYL